jgi:4-carboxymuconolactone decarboxylase
MARSPDLAFETLTAEQKPVYDEIMGRIGGRAVRGPFAVLLNAPAVADGAIRTYSAFRASKLERRLFELMILVVARHCRAHYEWFAHAPRALEAGISPETIEAIRTWRVPVLTRDDDKLVYDIVTELSTTRRLSQASYDRAQAALGVERLVELVAGAGFYTMIAMTINAFDVSPPDGARPLQE